MLPFNPYNFFLSYCSEKEAISNVLSERTKKDAPGPVSGHLIFKDNGIVLEWQDPINPNGLLDHYWIQWNLGNESKAINISATESCFRFPNTTNEDIFNITIRALGESGIGNPLYINLANFKDIPALEARTRNWNTPIFVVSLVVSIFILIILLCVIACNMRLKSSKNSTSTIQISQPPPMTIPVDNICNIDMQEMQTLITRTDINIPNGRPHENRLEGQTNGTPNEMQRILIVTSTPNKSHNEEIDQDDEVPVFGMELPANEIVQISIADPTFIKKPINGQKLNVQNVHYFKSLHNSQKPNSPLSPAAAVEHPEKYSPKLQVIPNGNLRITENPQVSKILLKLIFISDVL